jgi:hypothetical protein
MSLPLIGSVAAGHRTIRFLFFLPFTFLVLHHWLFLLLFYFCTIALFLLLHHLFYLVWRNFWQLFANFCQLFDNFWQLTTFLPFFDNFLTLFFIFIVLSSCDNKYYGTNFIYAVSFTPYCTWSPNYSVLVRNPRFLLKPESETRRAEKK